MFSLLLLVIDASDIVPKLYVDVLGGLFAFGRIFHMMGMWAHEGTSVGRIVGGFSTLVSLMIGSCMAMYAAIQPLVQLEDGLSRVKIIFVSIALVLFSAKMLAGKILD